MFVSIAYLWKKIGRLFLSCVIILFLIFLPRWSHSVARLEEWKDGWFSFRKKIRKKASHVFCHKWQPWCTRKLCNMLKFISHHMIEWYFYNFLMLVYHATVYKQGKWNMVGTFTGVWQTDGQTGVISRTVSKFSQIIVQILDEKRSLCVFKPPLRQHTLFILDSLESLY